MTSPNNDASKPTYIIVAANTLLSIQKQPMYLNSLSEALVLL